MAEAALTEIVKQFGESTAADDILMATENGEFSVLVGPSDCGKATTLRMVASPEDTTQGEIKIGGHVATKVPPKDRNTPMLLRNYAFYLHMDVFNNLALRPRLRKTPTVEVQ